MSRPHWLPEIVWMGVTIGQWPIETFSSEGQARDWAAKAPWVAPAQDYEARRIWSVAIPADTVVYKAMTIPATTELKQVHP